MTEVVQKRLELMTEELEEMRRTKLFTIQETTIIFKKRKQFEHKIHALTKDLKSYHDYINYEKCLLKDVALRRRKFKIAEKRNSIDQRIIKRIKSLYDTALQRFRDDLSLFLAFLQFCKKVNYVNAASDAVANMIKTHSDKPEVWKIAANWHMYDRKDIKTSLVMLLKGLELHKGSKVLYKEVILNEVYNVEHNKADENTSVNRIMGVVDTIFNNIQSPDFYVEILELLSDHEYSMDIQNYIIQTMMEKHFDNENLWHSLAQREFQSAQPETKLNICIEKYKEGLSKVTPGKKPKLWALYLDFLIHLHVNTDFDVSTVLKTALCDASDEKSVSERFYIAWLDLVSDEPDLVLQILEKGTSEFPHSVDLWNLHLHHSILRNNSEEVSQVFKLGVKNLKNNSLPLWQAVIQYYRNEDCVNEIYEDGVAQPKEISDVLKPLYINWLTINKGIEAARQVYARLSLNRPYCYSLHKMMSEIESKEENKNLKAWEKVHEIACSQFGKEDVDVWINCIHFYLHHYAEQTQRVHLLYNQAQRNLPKTLVVDFLSTYSHIMDDQPLSALEICKTVLTTFPNDVSISTEVARLYESLGDVLMSVKYYRNIVTEDSMNTEAIACIGVYHFYNNQPEFALRHYRRVLAMGVHSAELYNNLGLCCLYSQQLDLTMACFQRALDLAIDPLIKAEIWYNLSHVAIAAGDVELAMQCLSICLIMDSTHAPAFNNIAILQYKMGRTNLAKAYFNTAKNLHPSLLEPKKNLEYLQNRYLNKFEE